MVITKMEIHKGEDTMFGCSINLHIGYVLNIFVFKGCWIEIPKISAYSYLPIFLYHLDNIWQPLCVPSYYDKPTPKILSISSFYLK